EKAREAVDVRLVQRSVHLVQDAEGGGLVAEDRDEERDRRQRLLSSREEQDRLIPLAGGMRDDLDSRFEEVRFVEEPHFGGAPLEQTREYAFEVLVDCGERVAESLGGSRVDLPDRLLQLGDRPEEIVALGRQEGQALGLLLVLLEGEDVHGPQT